MSYAPREERVDLRLHKPASNSSITTRVVNLCRDLWRRCRAFSSISRSPLLDDWTHQEKGWESMANVMTRTGVFGGNREHPCMSGHVRGHVRKATTIVSRRMSYPCSSPTVIRAISRACREEQTRMPADDWQPETQNAGLWQDTQSHFFSLLVRMNEVRTCPFAC